MRAHIAIIGAAAVVVAGGLLAGPLAAQSPKSAAVFTADGKLEFPKDYREWVHLSTGYDMAYVEGGTGMGHHMFDNVYADRAAYAAFQQTGHWPEGTVLMLEARMGEAKGSINKAGQFQGGVMGMEAHVKDKRFPSGWAFFPFRTQAPSTALPQTSDCNTCHEQHAAVDTTFVQFYPTLMPVAKAKQSLSAAYLAEEKAR